jgi:hypothetical protein
MTSQSNLHHIAIRKVMRKRYKVTLILPCSNTIYSRGSMLRIGDDNSGANDVAVGLVVGLYCRAGAGPIQFSGDTVLVMRPC